jgi:hypothetical protein
MSLNVITNSSAPGPPEPAAPPTTDAAPGSVLATLRARAAAQRHTSTLVLPVGGSFPELHIRYKLPDATMADRLMARAAQLNQDKTGPQVSAFNVDLMTSACDTLLFRHDDGHDEDLKVGLDHRLWELVGWELPASMTAGDVTVHEIIGTLFDNNWFRVNAHGGELLTWLQDPGGESPGEASAASS